MHELTAREHAVARLIHEGLTNKQIAERLAISWYTVRGHALSIMTKLDLDSRIAIALWVERNG